jgi:hypothetical protein
MHLKLGDLERNCLLWAASGALIGPGAYIVLVAVVGFVTEAFRGQPLSELLGLTLVTIYFGLFLLLLASLTMTPFVAPFLFLWAWLARGYPAMETTGVSSLAEGCSRDASRWSRAYSIPTRDAWGLISRLHSCSSCRRGWG